MKTFHAANKLSQTEEKVIEHKSTQYCIIKSDKVINQSKKLRPLRKLNLSNIPVTTAELT